LIICTISQHQKTLILKSFSGSLGYWSTLQALYSRSLDIMRLGSVISGATALNWWTI